ncbi:hypothetical protein XB05_19380 [Xanthomonas arboricola]|uniref:hypothetical protein n=1 Tax=Xanthomonas arboricola TaxID=56448 RepID=UPI00061A400C|nr:hypothetical protein [Xanthomonas arboricola]AKC80657.1 hypothetical protein XB05_19380 [Xanthomonas arboricola]
MTDVSKLELAAYHEAAHAVFTFNDRWHFLCGDVHANEAGHGEARFALNNEAARNEMATSHDRTADRVFLKAAVIALVGICAKIKLCHERGAAAFDFDEASNASPTDITYARQALGHMVNPQPFSIVAIATQRAISEQPHLWANIERFACC